METQSAAAARVPSSKGALSPAREHLVELFQWIRFGRVESLRVLNAEPLLDPLPRIIRDIRLGRTDGPHRMLTAHDFALKAEVLALFRIFDEERFLFIESIDVQHGLPHRVSVSTTEER